MGWIGSQLSHLAQSNWLLMAVVFLCIYTLIAHSVPSILPATRLLAEWWGKVSLKVCARQGTVCCPLTALDYDN